MEIALLEVKCCQSFMNDKWQKRAGGKYSKQMLPCVSWKKSSKQSVQLKQMKLRSFGK